MEAAVFDWFEYVVFAATLMLSTVIGIFFCCSKGGQNTVASYFLGNKQLSVFPVSMSLIASFISGITLLGLPSEVYNNGSQIMLACIAKVILFIINVTTFQPVYYNLQLVTLYEYFEMRFNHRVRVIASALFTIAWMSYMPIVIYGPALAFNQVSGVSLHIISPLVCCVCIFYTTVGGLKAVVWADALQGTVMLCALIIVIFTGLAKVGGIGEVFSAAVEGKRLEFFNFNIDPTERLTFWSSTIGIAFMWLSDVTSPVAAQRYLALPTLTAARKATFCLLVGVSSFYLLSGFMGLIIYTKYRTCDPLSSKMIKRSDQILPFFIMDVAKHLKGLPGLFVAGIVCAALSTLSTAMNTLSGTIYEDFVEPILGKKSDRAASNIMKLLSVLVGVICTGLVPFVEKLGSIIDMAATIGGVTGGAIFGIFAMGVLIPKVNAKGAYYGGLIACLLMIWTMIGHEFAPKCNTKKPISIEGCDHFNITSHYFSTTTPGISSTKSEFNNSSDDLTSGVWFESDDTIRQVTPDPSYQCSEVSLAYKIAFPLYRLTTFYYGLLGFMLSVIIGMTVSYFTGFNDPSKVNPKLLAPYIRRFIVNEDAKYKSVPSKNKNKELSVEFKNML